MAEELTAKTLRKSNAGIQKTDDWIPCLSAGKHPFYHFAAQMFSLFFHLYGGFEVIGKENVPKDGSVLLVANHVSYLDPPALGVALYRHRHIRFMAKIELWKHPVLAWMIDRLMGFPVKRGTADITTLRRAIAWLKSGEAVAMFPEGERSHDGKIQQLHDGVTLIIKRAQATVIPVGIIGTFERMPRNRNTIKPKKVTVVFGAPLTFPENADRATITGMLVSSIAGLTGQDSSTEEKASGVPIP